MATDRARAGLAAIGREATTFTLLASVPEEMPEAEVREYLRAAYAAAGFEDVTVVREKREEVLVHVSASGVRTSKEAGATRAVLSKAVALMKDTAADNRTTEKGTATLEGAVVPGEYSETASTETTEDSQPAADPEWFIVMAGTAGIEGTLLQYAANRGTMEAMYPKHFLQRIEELPKQAATAELIRAGLAAGAAVAVPGGDGGVYGALWKLGEKLRCGMKVELPRIPIAQITIEVCETADIDPYQIPAGGSALFVTEDPERLMKALPDGSVSAEDAPKQLKEMRDGFAEKTLPVEVIGYLTKEAARILCNRGEERYLEPYRGGA